MLKSKLFTRYVTSYTVLFFIPLLILAFYAFHNFNDVLRKEINSHNSRLLEQSKNAIDLRVEEMIKLSIQISNNPYFSKSHLEEDSFLNVVQATKLLENFSIPNNFYSNFFIYYFDRDLIYSPQGTYSPQYFSKSIYKYDNWSLEQLKNQVIMSRKGFVRPAEYIHMNNSSERYITYVAPLPYSSEQPSGAVFYLIRESAIYNMVKETLISNKSSILILDNEFNPITMLGDLEINSVDLQQLRQHRNQFALKTTIKDKPYFISSITSNKTSWTYISFMPTDIVTGKLSQLKMSTIELFLFLFIIGILLIYFFMHLNYKPLNELTKMATRIAGSTLSTPLGGLETVHSAVDHMSRQINVLEQKVESAAVTMRFRLLQQLLKGYFADQEEFNLKGAEYGLTISGTSYAVLIIMFDSIKQLDEEQIDTAFKETFAHSYHYFVLENVPEDQIFLILNDENDQMGACESLCTELLKNFKNNYGIHCTIGIGNWHSSISDISKSYLQACSAIDYWPIRGKHTIITYQQMEESMNYISHYPHQQVELLKAYISERDAVNFATLLDAIIKSLQEKNIPLITARLIFYNMVQAIIHTIYKNNYELNEEIIKNLDIISLARQDSVDDLSIRIKAICSELFVSVDHKGLAENKQNGRMKQYIEEHYCESHFSLQSMSDYLNISVSYLSHSFKAQFNRNISDYVNDLRMTKVKCDLTNTDKNVQEIAQSVGYLNQSSFIRKFKQTTGITPGAYRELSRKGTK
ncbi:AraC-like DNA-binding protein [Paenibacillus castaneae]|uniref:helix-turn-helix domain-containing protein n=1 Tax=Paenibacillus castaneae TaxID=474957 RepID=UPI000C99C8D8|nr:helix-turn-helix domain-containing protein [Paenibacillus castaneae]NIK78326.1 AraC-like DNA-binding protein [Paenibacillus castaneae]